MALNPFQQLLLGRLFRRPNPFIGPPERFRPSPFGGGPVPGPGRPTPFGGGPVMGGGRPTPFGGGPIAGGPLNLGGGMTDAGRAFQRGWFNPTLFSSNGEWTGAWANPFPAQGPLPQLEGSPPDAASFVGQNLGNLTQARARRPRPGGRY